MATRRSQPSWPPRLVAMNLVRGLFKKHGHQHGASSPADSAPAHSDGRCRSPASDDADGKSPTKSPRRKTHSSMATVDVKGCVKSDMQRNPLHSNVVFKAIKMSSHKRFAQVLPNLLLGTQHWPFLVLTNSLLHSQSATLHSQLLPELKGLT